MKRKFNAFAEATRRNAQRLGVVASGVALAALPGLSQAAIDVTDVVTEIKATVTPINLLGAAVLIVLVTAAAYKWVRRGL